MRMGLALLATMLAAPTTMAAQSGTHTPALGLELSIYPSGFISAARAVIPIGSTWSVEGTLGVNLTDRGDFGEHDDEEGEGPGVGLGLRWSEGGTRGWSQLDPWRRALSSRSRSGARLGSERFDHRRTGGRGSYSPRDAVTALSVLRVLREAKPAPE